MAAPKTLTLDEKHAEAVAEAAGLRAELHVAETARDLAVGEGRYIDAETARGEANQVREQLLVAEAHATALDAGVAAMRAHLEEEQRARQEREAREQASVEHDAAIEAEQVEAEVAARLWAELQPSYDALRQVIDAVMAADARLFAAQQAKHGTGVASGRLHPEHPRPSAQRLFASRVQNNEVLSFVLRHPRLFPQ